MKNQHKKTVARNFGFSKLAIVLLMIATMLCCFTVLASAQDPVVIGAGDLTGLEYSNGIPYKVYDGNKTASVGLSTTAQAKLDAIIETADQALVSASVKAEFDSADVDSAKNIVVSFVVTAKTNSAAATAAVAKYQAMMPDGFSVPAKIVPAEVEWNYGSAGKVTADLTYVPGKTDYSVKLETLPTLNATGVSVVAGDVYAAINGVVAPTEATVYNTTVRVALNSTNYVAAPLNVAVTVNPIVIDEIVWEGYADTQYVFTWGDAALANIKAYAKVKTDGTNYDLYAMNVTFPANFGEVGSYQVTAVPVVGMTLKSDVTSKQTVTVNKKVFQVSMSGASFVGNADYQNPPSSFSLAVEGDLPADIRALIQYANNAQTAYGTYTVTATLPSSANYEFRDANGVVTTLTATMYINRQYVAATNSDFPYQVILVGQNGFTGDVKADFTIPTDLNRRAFRGYRFHKEYTLSVQGADGETFTVLIPITDALYHKYCDAPTANDLYIYEDVTGVMTPANQKTGYTVTVKDGYIQIDGVSGNATLTFVVAPNYNAPFFLTPWGIALLILLIVALIALLILIGLYLRRVRLSEENEELVIDTEGEVPEVVEPELEDKVDVDEAIDAELDQIAESIEPEAEAEADAEGVEEAVAESMDELMEEVSAIELEKEETAEDDSDIAAEMADAKAEELQDTDAEADADAEADEDALRAAVAEAMAENFNESADATDAILLVADAEDEITPEDFKAVVDAIVSDAMCATMDLPEAVEETAEEATVEAVEETAEEATVEAVEETAEEATVEAVEETAEEATVEAVEETAEEAAVEATEETAEKATVEATEEATEEVVVDEMSNDDICAVVADSVAEAFELVTVDGVTPKAVDGTTKETITEAVNAAADANVPETWTEAWAEAVKEAVVDELAARLLVEAVETFAAVNENEDDDNDEDEDDSFFGFGSMPLDFIDAVAEADKYAEMLEQERRGEVRLVTRYRRSFESRVSQAQDNIQEYYSILKNALLGYKGVKNRVSWNYEAFNRGRVHVAKLNVKTKTLYLYLALDPAELAETKYGIVDMSSKKKYATVPVLMKIKGERKFKYALELIDKLCGENLTLPKLEREEIDYKLPYQTTEELVQAGLVKKMVASVPVVYSEAPVVETPVEPASPATEEQEVTFVAPTDNPAVTAAAEEVAADAPASTEEENKEV